MAGLRGRKNYVQLAIDAMNDGDVSTPIVPRGTAAQRKMLRSLEKLRVAALEQQVRQARAIARRSLRELASDLHVSHTLLNRYETGAAKPVASMLLKIADALQSARAQARGRVEARD